MSYNRIKGDPVDLSNAEVPLNNGERYPPIPLPPPDVRADVSQSPTHNTGPNPLGPPPMLETGVIMIQQTPGFVVASGSKDGDLETKHLIFNDQSIRKGFIRKVYYILLTQLLFTCGIISVFMYHEPTKYFVQENPVVLGVSMIVNIVVMFSMACCETARRAFPVNFVCLGLFTVTMSLLLGAVSSTLDADVVLLAVGVTALMVVGLTIFAIQTKYDFTAWGGVLVSAILCLFVISLMGIFRPSLISNAAISSLGALLASFLLIYDTQLIIGGKHKYQFNPEDYIFAALTLYVDVVRIFLYVLRFARR